MPEKKHSVEQTAPELREVEAALSRGEGPATALEAIDNGLLSCADARRGRVGERTAPGREPPP